MLSTSFTGFGAASIDVLDAIMDLRKTLPVRSLISELPRYTYWRASVDLDPDLTGRKCTFRSRPVASGSVTVVF
jgi:hypothetical protein